jgi:hypothetical protein
VTKVTRRTLTLREHREAPEHNSETTDQFFGNVAKSKISGERHHTNADCDQEPKKQKLNVGESYQLLIHINQSYCLMSKYARVWNVFALTDGRTESVGGCVKIFGPKSEDMRGGCREPHNADLHDLLSPNIFSMNR